MNAPIMNIFQIHQLLKDYIFLKLFTYSAALGLGCSLWDLCRVTQGLSLLAHRLSHCGTRCTVSAAQRHVGS